MGGFLSSKKAEVIFAVVSYSLCSGSLVLVNKLTLYYLPYPSLVVTVQLWAALLFIQLGNAFHFIEVDPIILKFVKPYLLYTVAFSLGVYCNMMSLSLSNVETVIVFRALAPLLVSIFDATCLGREWPSLRSWGALMVIALGALGYAMTDEQFKSQGVQAYFWPTLYLFVISFEMAYGKKIVSGCDMKTISGPVLYTNLLGWPPMLGFAAMGGEYDRLKNDVTTRVLNGETHLLPIKGVFLLFLGCFVGTGIGYSGWFCRKRVSATSYTLIGVINKCLTVLVNLLVSVRWLHVVALSFTLQRLLTNSTILFTDLC
jgi:GDP-mannose transporter